MCPHTDQQSSAIMKHSIYLVGCKPLVCRPADSLLRAGRTLRALCALALCAASQAYVVAQSSRGLKDAYRGHFDVGVSLSLKNLGADEQRRLVTDNFSTVTAENAMKPASVHPREGVYTWEAADSIANFCRRHGLRMRGHCLCWHHQFPDWMFLDSLGREVDKEVFYTRLREHIHAVVSRYKDVVDAWDVVNEAVADGPADVPCAYHQSKHYKLCGDEFIARAFIYAHEADSTARLFYNDYSTVDPAKRDRIVAMIRKMKAQGAPIHGLGMQAHYNIYWPGEQQLEAAIDSFAQVVDVIHITELDVRANHEEGGQLQHSQGAAGQPDQAVLARFDRQYASLFRVFRRHSDVIGNVTFWNLTDRDSWLGADNYPLLFDCEGKPKAAYYIVRDLGEAQ